MLYTLKEFAAKTGKKTKDLSVYRGRHQLVYGDDELIDTEDEVNAAFWEKHAIDEDAEAPVLKRPVKKHKRSSVKKKALVPADDDYVLGQEFIIENEEDLDDEEEDNPTDIPGFLTSEREFKHFQARKFNFEQQLKELELQKRLGLLIPTELVGAVISRQSKTMSAQYRQATDRLVDIFMLKYKITDKDAADMRKTLVDLINVAITSSVTESKKAVAAIVAEYSEKRTAPGKI